MTERNNVVLAPVYCKNRFLVLFGEHDARGHYLPDYEKAALVPCGKVLATRRD